MAFSRRACPATTIACLAGDPLAYPSVFASKGACWVRRVFHRWGCLRQIRRVATYQGADSPWDVQFLGLMHALGMRHSSQRFSHCM